jgi:hypothetical protein
MEGEFQSSGILPKDEAECSRGAGVMGLVKRQSRNSKSEARYSKETGASKSKMIVIGDAALREMMALDHVNQARRPRRRVRFGDSCYDS